MNPKQLLRQDQFRKEIEAQLARDGARALTQLLLRRENFRRLYEETLSFVAESAESEDTLAEAVKAAGLEWPGERLTDRPWIDRAELLREFGLKRIPHR